MVEQSELWGRQAVNTDVKLNKTEVFNICERIWSAGDENNKTGSPLPECPLFSTVMLIELVWPMKSKGGRALLTWTLLVTILIGDWRNPPQLGN